MYSTMVPGREKTYTGGDVGDGSEGTARTTEPPSGCQGVGPEFPNPGLWQR